MVSVIVPVYNAEHCLGSCVEMILAQDIPDFELLLVDDGSSDKSGSLCDAYAQKDSRIRAFHKENGGASSARNLGLDQAKANFLCLWMRMTESRSTIYRRFFRFNKKQKPT